MIEENNQEKDEEPNEAPITEDNQEKDEEINEAPITENKEKNSTEGDSNEKRTRRSSKHGSSKSKGGNKPSEPSKQNDQPLLTEDVPILPLTEKEKKVIWKIKHFLYPIINRARSNKDQKRRNIIRELIQTERNYVQDLTILIEVYYKPLDLSIATRKPLIDSVSLRELFGNCDEIRDAHQEGILSVMETEILPKLQLPEVDKSIYTRLANCFLSIIPVLHQLYSTYLSTKEHSDELMQRLKKSKPFREFTAKQLFNPASKCQEIEDLIILPTQRMGGYKLLLERLLKYSDVGGFETIQSDLRSVLDAIISVGKTMNQTTTDSSNQEKILNVAENVSHLPPFLVLMKAGRKYIGDFTCHKYDSTTGETGEKVNGYIFNDIMLLTTVIKGRFGTEKHVYLDAIPYIQIKIEPCELSIHSDRSFCMKTDTQEYYLRMMKSKAKKEFQKFIKSKKKKIREDVQKQSNEGQAYMKSLLDELRDKYLIEQQSRTREEVLASFSS